MESLLTPIYSSLPLQILFGLLLGGNVALPVMIRYQMLVRRYHIDLAGLAVYQRSGLWLALFLAFIGTFLPSFLTAVTLVVLPIVFVNLVVVGQVESRVYRDP
jgi:hypothetical protein